MTASRRSQLPLAWPHHRRPHPSRARRAPAGPQHPLDVRQAGGARLGPVQADLAAADRRSGDPGGGSGSDDRCARERRLHELSRGQAADEPPAAREPDRRSRPGLRGHGGGEPPRPAAHPGRVRRRSPCSRRPQFVKVLHGDTKAVDTSNGDVVLDIRPLVLKLGDRFGFVTDLADQIPPDAGQVTILEADNLDTAQKLTHWLEQIANFVWIFARRRLGRAPSGWPAGDGGRRFARSASVSSSSA